MWMPFLPMGSKPLGFAPLQAFISYPWQAYVHIDDGLRPMLGIQQVAVSTTALSRGTFILLSQAADLQLFQQYAGAHSLGGLAESHSIPSPSIHVSEGYSFLGLILPDDTVDSESVVGMKPGDLGLVIGYQVDEFAHI